MARDPVFWHDPTSCTMLDHVAPESPDRSSLLQHLAAIASSLCFQAFPASRRVPALWDTSYQGDIGQHHATPHFLQFLEQFPSVSTLSILFWSFLALSLSTKWPGVCCTARPLGQAAPAGDWTAVILLLPQLHLSGFLQEVKLMLVNPDVASSLWMVVWNYDNCIGAVLRNQTLFF